MRSSRLTACVLILVAAGSVLTRSADAGSSTAHFQPEPGAFASFDFVLKYQNAVRKVLFPKGPPEAEFGAVVLPSFTSEWALFLHSEGDGLVTVEIRVVDGQVWAATQASEPIPGFTAHSQRLDAEAGRAAVSALRHALQSTRHPDPSTTLGLDGTTFHFFSFGSPLLAGHT